MILADLFPRAQRFPEGSSVHGEGYQAAALAFFENRELERH